MEVDDKKSRAEDKVALSEFKNIELAVKFTGLRLNFLFIFCHALLVVLALLLMMAVHLQRLRLGSLRFVHS